MIELIEWLAYNVPIMLDQFSMKILDGLSPDLTILLAYFPFLEQAYSVFMWVGLSVIILMLIMNLMRVFAGPILDNVDMPFPVLARALLFFFITLNIHHFCLMAIDLAKYPYEAIWNMPLFAADPELPFENLMAITLHNFDNLGALADLISLIMIVALFINYIRLLLEAVERYVLIGAITFLSPLAASLGSSRSTGGVFKSWLRMYASGLFLLTMNVWFIRAFISGIAIGITTHGVATTDSGYVGSYMLWMFAMLAILKVGQRIDSIMAAVGMNTAQTGQGLYLEAVAAGKMVASGIKEISKHFGGGSVRDSGMTEKSSVFTRSHDAKAAGMGPRSNNETLVDMRKNREGTQYQSKTMEDGKGITTITKTNLKTDPAPKGAYYITHNGKDDTPWAVQATGANAAAYLGPQFGEYSNNTGFQIVAAPNKYGQMQAQPLADKFRNEYVSALKHGELPPEAYAKAYNETREYVKENTAQEVLADGKSQISAIMAGERAADGFEQYNKEATEIFGENLPEFAAIETDPENGGHLTIYGTSYAGMPVHQEYYLASAYSRPQGAYETITDNDGNAWYVIDHAQYDANAVGDPLYFSESYMPEIGEVVTGQVTDVDDSRKEHGIFTVKTEQECMIRDSNGTITPDIQRNEYQVIDAAAYRPPQGEYTVTKDSNGHEYYVVRGQEVIKAEAQKNRTTGEPIVDERGSVVTKRVIAYNHERPIRAGAPEKKEKE